MNNLPYRAVAKWLAEVLRPFRNQLSRYFTVDSFDLVDSVLSVNVTGKWITSLFTYVPLTETIYLLCDYIESNKPDVGVPLYC